MMIGEGTLDVLQWVGLLAGVVGAAFFRAVPRGDYKKLAIAFGAIALAIFVAFGLRHLGAPVVIVKIPTGGMPEKTRARLYGSDEYKFLDGHVERLARAPKGTRVVNDSANTMEIVTKYYGSIGFPSKPVPVPPLSMADAEYGIDYVGADEPPPSHVSSSISFDIKYWLTW